ncbi:hypothetical protein [Humitalea rosea]|uniref:hypothetical protein n=1 Tax=Humitalea rosea TaxID=990373 RepID=UPI001313E583|nr:hypothetical protein [Humitalea rosea]
MVQRVRCCHRPPGRSSLEHRPGFAAEQPARRARHRQPGTARAESLGNRSYGGFSVKYYTPIKKMLIIYYSILIFLCIIIGSFSVLFFVVLLGASNYPLLAIYIATCLASSCIIFFVGYRLAVKMPQLKNSRNELIAAVMIYSCAMAVFTDGNLSNTITGFISHATVGSALYLGVRPTA